MAKRKFVRHSKGHYFASSIAEWRTEEDHEKLVKFMKAGGFDFSVIFVPLPKDAEYEIVDFVPDVEGCILLEHHSVAK